MQNNEVKLSIKTKSAFTANAIQIIARTLQLSLKKEQDQGH